MPSHSLFRWTIFGGVVKDERSFRYDPTPKANAGDLHIRNYAPTTVAAYIRSVAEFAKHFDKSPDLLALSRSGNINCT